MDNSASGKIKVMLVDDHSIVRMGIAKLLENEPDIEVVGESGNINEAINMISRITPQVVLVDIAFEGEMSGLDLIKAIKERYPDIIMIVLSMFDETVYAERAVRAGARGYIQKSDAPKKIVSAIHNALTGELVLSKSISDKIINKVLTGEHDASGSPIDLLSDREFEIFQMFGKGMVVKEIAAELNISSHTVETHRRNIKEKLQIKTNALLIKQGVQWISSHA